MAYTFQGGIHPDDKKAATNKRPIEQMPAPAKVILPVSMHIGAPAKPVVAKGDTVFMGQLVAEAGGNVSANVHASVSGTVSDVALYPHPNGTKVLSVVIDNDGLDTPDPSLVPLDYSSMTPEEMLEVIRSAGIVGHGGATFPTHVKIQSGIGKVDTIIINGAECEPYITSDHRILLEHPEEVIEGAQILIKTLGVENVLLGIEENKADTYDALRKLLPQNNSIKLCPLKTRYPQGAEKQIIYALTGREVPSGKLPADAGCAVFNVDTAATICRKFKTGMNDIRRIVTVSGSAVATPKNLEVRVGTPIGDVFAAAGGFTEAPNKLLMGGPMMGNPQFDLSAPVIKATNALLAFCGDECKLAKNPSCIRCGRCVSACPMHLMPTYLYLYSNKGNFDACAKYDALDCIECGACTYVCPGKLPLVQGIRVAKQRILDARRK
ncbi:electron transport complex subunit RsxC [Acidaminobacterium chupaoyuni]